MQILLVEPFFTGSHQQWAEGYRNSSQHQVHILSLPGRHWKWRMYGGAVSLARKFMESSLQPDLILVSDMLDLPTFLSLTRKRTQDVPTAVYFHENQITYPWSPNDKDPKLQRNNQYGFINYTSALTADQIFFNSNYHQHSFLSALKPFLKQFPDHQELDLIDQLQHKSEVLSLGMNLKALQQDIAPDRPNEPVIVWNHRWEYDKNPDLFFSTLQEVHQLGYPFKLIVLGEQFKYSPKVFAKAKEHLATHILHFGYAANRFEYANWLHLADIVPVTSRQDFFGGSAVEAIYCNCYPLLPHRLAFSEHIPADKFSQHLYEKDEDLLPRLIALFSQINEIRSNSHYRNFVAQYDWRILAPIYDKKMGEVVKRRGA